MSETKKAVNLPEGWEWTIYDRGHWGKDAFLHAPHGCSTGEVKGASGVGRSWRLYSHTWDEDGTGGENSIHDTLEGGMAFVEAAILRQGFHMNCDLNCSDHGCEESAAETAAGLIDDLDEKGAEALKLVVEEMLGPKRFREWCEDYEIE